MGRARECRALAVAAALAFSGCSGEMLETRPRVRGPVPEVKWIDPGGGHAKYSLQGGKWAVEGRRSDVLFKIADYCGGSDKFKIADELDRSETEVAYTSGDMEDTVAAGEKHFGKAAYHHVYFECLP